MKLRSLTAAVFATVPLCVCLPAAADNSGPFAHRSETTAKAASDSSSFVATSTTFVDHDGTAHPIKVGGGHSASPYEYQVHRFQGICPNDALGQPQDLVFVDYRLVSAGPNAPWTPGDVFCSGPQSQPLDVGNIAAQVATVTESLKPPPPTITVRPDGKNLVGNPTVFSGSDLGDQTPPALINPLSGRALQLTVHPTTWTWDFDDGSPTVTTQGPPPAYDGSLNGLLTHTYTRAADVHVRVTVTWSASYTITGVAGAQAVANTVSSAVTVPLQVRAARSQLVSH
jgi:hypothetical protein